VPFDPDKFLAETAQQQPPQRRKFDPDAFLSETQPPPESRMIEAGIQGFGEGATLGYLPQLQALAGKGIEFLTPESEADKALKAQGFTIGDEPESYTEMRDKFVGRGEALAEQEPIATMAGQLGGGLISGLAMAPLTGGATAATTMARIGQAAKTGATMGFLYNPGETEGEVSPLQIKERLKNMAYGAVTGAITQGGLEGVAKTAKAIGRIPGTLKRYAEVKSFKASGAMLKDFRLQYGRKKVNDIGRSMLDHNVVALGDDISDIAKKSEIMKNHVGNKIGEIYKNADDQLLKLAKPNKKQAAKLADTALDTIRLSDEIATEVHNKYTGKVGGKKVIDAVFKNLDEIAENGNDLTMSKWQEIRRSIDDNINWARDNELPGVERELKGMRTKMQSYAKKRLATLDDIFGGQRSKEIVKANKDFSNLADVAKMAKDKMAREESKAAFGLRERLQSGVGAVVGGMVGGVPGAIAGGAIGSVATKAARQYGTPIVARSANKIGQILEKNPQLLGKFAQPLMESLKNSPKEFAAVLTNFMQDPEFKKAVGQRKIRPVGMMGN